MCPCAVVRDPKAGREERSMRYFDSPSRSDDTIRDHEACHQRSSIVA